MLTLDEIKNKIKECLRKLYEKDAILFERNNGKGLCERCLVFRFGLYLQEAFNDYFVDCDFNSSIVNGHQASGKPITNPNNTITNRFVDIIVHKRAAPPNSDFICFEIKKWSNANTEATEKDMNNLRVLTSEYGYLYGFYLIFGRNLNTTKWIVFHRDQVPEQIRMVFQNETTN